MLKIKIITVILGLLLFSGTALAQETTDYPRPKTVTMLDLGAKSCIPCKMMAPILEKLNKDYQGRADVIFIDVSENPGEAQKYKIRVIPTQIFYNKNGQEVERHEGFLDEPNITSALDKLLAE